MCTAPSCFILRQLTNFIAMLKRDTQATISFSFDNPCIHNTMSKHYLHLCAPIQMYSAYYTFSLLMVCSLLIAKGEMIEV